MFGNTVLPYYLCSIKAMMLRLKTVQKMKKQENFYVSLIRNGRMTKDEAIRQIVKNINHHAGILARVQHDGTFRYQTILNHRAELNTHIDHFKAVSDYQLPVS